MPRVQSAAILLSLATLSVPAFAQGTDPAVRDSSSVLNYVLGQATLDGQPVTTNSQNAPRRLHAGEVLATTQGSADVMLVPGSLLRLGQGTDVSLVATDGKRVEVRLENGRANVAVSAIRPDTLLLVDMPQGQTQILERGLYTFDTAGSTVRVFNGEANVFPGQDTNSSVKPIKVKNEHEVELGEARVKPTKFDRMEQQNSLLPWTGPQEAHADGDFGLPTNSDSRGDSGYSRVGYGFGPGPYAFGYPGYGLGYGYGWGYPYGAYGYPYGFYGYPLGLGIGLGYSGYYGGGFPYHGPSYGGYRGGYQGGLAGGYRGGTAVGRGFSGGGGGFHGGGGRR